MAEHTYRVVEIVGTSPAGIDEAIANGVQRAGETLRHLDWFEVAGIRGQLNENGVAYYQVTMKIGFRVESPEERAAP